MCTSPRERVLLLAGAAKSSQKRQTRGDEKPHTPKSDSARRYKSALLVFGYLTLRNRPPITVIAYVAIVATALAVTLVHDGLQPNVVMGGLVLVVASFGLWRGVWVAWLFLTVVEAGNLAIVLINQSTWWIVLVKTTMVALLLSQSTRRYARRRRRTRAVA